MRGFIVKYQASPGRNLDRNHSCHRETTAVGAGSVGAIPTLEDTNSSIGHSRRKSSVVF